MNGTMVGNIKIHQITDTATPLYDVDVNGKKINNITSIEFYVDPYQIPVVQLGLASGIDYDGLADVSIDISPESTVECIRGLDFALRMDEDLRNGFLASIRSALDEAGNYENNNKLAERILDRVLGTEVDDGI